MPTPGPDRRSTLRSKAAAFWGQAAIVMLPGNENFDANPAPEEHQPRLQADDACHPRAGGGCRLHSGLGPLASLAGIVPLAGLGRLTAHPVRSVQRASWCYRRGVYLATAGLPALDRSPSRSPLSLTMPMLMTGARRRCKPAELADTNSFTKCGHHADMKLMPFAGYAITP